MTTSLIRRCQRNNCTRPANRYVLGTCDFRNKWQYRGMSLCRTHRAETIRFTSAHVVTDLVSRIAYLSQKNANRPVHAPVTAPVLCGKCDRPLKSAESIRRGYGKHCARLIRQSAEKAHAKREQIEKALEALSDRAIVALRPGTVWEIVSEDGMSVHKTARNACTCAYGRRMTRVDKVCWHRVTVELLTAA